MTQDRTKHPRITTGVALLDEAMSEGVPYVQVEKPHSKGFRADVEIKISRDHHTKGDQKLIIWMMKNRPSEEEPEDDSKGERAKS